MRSKNILGLLVLIMMFGWSSTVLADEVKDLQTSMKKSIGEVTSIIKDKSIAKDVRDREVDALVRPLFDFSLMARLSLGKKEWKKHSKEERKEFVHRFEERVVQSYMSKLDLFTDEVVIIDDAVRVKSRIHLPTHLMRKNEKRDILYKFYKSKKGKWLIYDVDILGVSIIQTYRTQFASILKKDNFDVLLDKLKTKKS